MKITKKVVCIILALVMLGSISAMAASHPFTDVSRNSWYAGDVEYVFKNGLMSGMGASAFAPHVNMNRAMLVTVLYRLENRPAVKGESPFTDTKKGAYYYDAVVWAYENEIVNGMSATLFAPGNNISREQMVTIFARYANYKGQETLALNDLVDYSDRQKVANYALNAFRWAVGAGIINGSTPTELNPQGTATRAQCAAILHRFIDWKDSNDSGEGDNWELPAQ